MIRGNAILLSLNLQDLIQWASVYLTLREAEHQEEFEADATVALFESGSLLTAWEYRTITFPFLIFRFFSLFALLECDS